jgi:hypothetical protein
LLGDGEGEGDGEGGYKVGADGVKRDAQGVPIGTSVGQKRLDDGVGISMAE